MPSDPVTTYLRGVRQVRRSGQGTAEQSFYPHVYGLLTAASSKGEVRRSALAHPAGIQGDFPDVAIYEDASSVLVLPVEVKPASTSIETLMASAQARGYAETYGGGVVLLTNIREWALARLDDSGQLVEEGRVKLVGQETDLDSAHPPVPPTAFRDLRMLIESGCTVRGSLSSPRTVAHLLAYHARNMRDAIMNAGDPAELLSSINTALSRGLQIELDAEMLTPTVVQTLVYGEFAAWLGVEEPLAFDWMQASYRLSVPVFAEILHEALRPALIRKCDLTRHLHAVGRVLRWTNRDTFEAAFDGDAIQYFYEPFLAEFDPHLRDALGVWYTPKEIAEYQVARADHHVRADLGITNGLADEAVYLLDPACGTGTYLIAACKLIFEFHRANGEPASVAAERAWTAMTSRFIGFEILPAAFIICHLHLHRFLQHLGMPSSDARLRIYLTNSLTGWREDDAPGGITLFPELEEELHDAAIAKQRDPVLVVLGNPPYQGYSTAETAEERQMLAPWIEALWPVWGLRKHRLNDLYVRFWRIALHRIVTLSQRGVVSFISNRKWLGGRSYPSMREAVVTGVQSIWVDDLHGDAHDRSHPGDQSIFQTNIAAGIKVGTAIVTAVRTGDPTGDATVYIADYRGSAADKRNELAQRRKERLTLGYTATPVTRESRYRLAADTGMDYPALNEYLPYFRSGVQPVRDEAVLDRDENALKARMQTYLDPDKTLDEVLADYPAFGIARSRYNPARTRNRLLANHPYDAVKIVRLLYRPFDTRYMYWEAEAKLLNEPRRELIPYWRNVPDQVCLIAAQTPRREGAVRPLAVQAVGGFHAADPDARVFPLYTPPTKLLGEDAGELPFGDHAGETAESNVEHPTLVAPEWVSAAQRTLGINDPKAAGEAVFYALVAIMQSPRWVADQPVQLDDFATVVIPGSKADLEDAATTGRQLVALMDPDIQVPEVTTGAIRANLRDIAIPDTVTRVEQIAFGTYGVQAGQHNGTDVMWSQAHGWRNVPTAVWEFSASGFQVLRKWLSYRTLELTAADRENFRILCRRVQAILDLADECDRLYEAAINNPLGT